MLDRAIRSVYLPAPSGLSPTPRRRSAPPSLGSMAHPMNRLPTGSAIDANAACRGGKQKTNGTKREWCPGSLESPATLRRSGRTETLTGQASHTSSRAKDRNKGQKERDRNIGAANGGKELNLARTRCCEVRSLLALLTLRSGSWLSGIRICTAAFRRRIPIGDGLLCAHKRHRMNACLLAGSHR